MGIDQGIYPVKKPVVCTAINQCAENLPNTQSATSILSQLPDIDVPKHYDCLKDNIQQATSEKQITKNFYPNKIEAGINRLTQITILSAQINFILTINFFNLFYKTLSASLIYHSYLLTPKNNCSCQNYLR